MSQNEPALSWQNRFWHLLVEVRGKVPLDVPNLIEIARQNNIVVDAAFIDWISSFVGDFDPYLHSLSPLFIADFIADYLRQTDHKTCRILDPCIGLGTMLSVLRGQLPIQTAIGIELNARIVETAQNLPGASDVEWRIGNGLELLDDIEANFDVVIADPPFIPTLHQITMHDLQGQPVSIRDTIGALLLLKSACLLSEDGIGFYLVPPIFMAARNERSVLRHLERFGLYMDAALALPSGTFAQSRKSEAYLIVVKRTKTGRLFVGELSRDRAAATNLLSNLIRRQSAEEPRLGTLVQRDKFTSFRTLIASRKIRELARNTNQTLKPFWKIATFRLLSNLSSGTIPNEPNSFYLPLIGNSDAVVSVSDFRIKAHNYIQIILDPDEADSTYFAHFFNTEFGHIVREANMSGVTIPKLTKTALEQAEIPVPKLETQTAIVRLNSQLTSLSTRLEEQQRLLWSAPQRHTEVASTVRAFQSIDGIELWINSLPFPLASILWLYHAARDEKLKVEYLLNFFEAVAEFFVILLASSLEQAPAYTQSSSMGDGIHASFGKWTYSLAHYTKRARALRKAPSTEVMCHEVFGYPDQGFLDMVMDEEIYKILERVRPQRNRWKGHGGIYAASDLQNRLVFLESELANLRSRISDRFSTVRLVTPLSMRFRNGLYQTDAQVLMGVQTPFRVEECQTIIPLEDQRLYILHGNHKTPVTLLPFIRISGLLKEGIEPVPEERNACYFFSRTEGQKLTFVSYHFAPQGELSVTDDQVTACLPLLFSDTSNEPISPDTALV